MKHLATLFCLIFFFSFQAFAQQEPSFSDQTEQQTIDENKEASASKPSPLFILKHKRASYELDSAQIKDLDPKTIKSIEVIKGDGAVAGWGVRAEHGVVVIHVDQKTFRKLVEQASK